MRKYRVTVNGQVFEVEVEELGGETRETAAPRFGPVSFPRPPAAPTAPGPAPRPEPKGKAPAAPRAEVPSPVEGEAVTAPLPGLVVDVKVSPGQQVSNGELLLILEAMKMENEVTAPVSGVVRAIKVSQGATVNTGDLMLVIE